MKHTPGPWARHPDYPWIIKQDLRPIGEIGDGVTVCGTNAHESSGFFPTPDEGRSNARLIAAAPDLLEACETLLFELVAGPAARDEVIANARAAIAKATGEAK